MAQVKERGGGGEERKETFPSFLSPSPLFHFFLVLVSFLARSKPKVSFHDLFAPKPNGNVCYTQAKIVTAYGLQI